MIRRSLVALCVAIVCVLLVAPLPAQAQETSAGHDPAPLPLGPSYADQELISLLQATSLTDEWLEATAVSGAAALVEIVGNTSYVEARADFVAELEQLDERRTLVEVRVADIDRVETHITDLEELIRTLRRTLTRSGRGLAASLTDDDVAAIETELAAVTGTRRWMGISLDPLELAGHHLVSVGDDVGKVVDALGRSADQGSKSTELEVSRLTTLHGELQQVRALVSSAEESSTRSQLALVSERATVIALMPELHNKRLLSPTAVGGLSVVTLDAYVRAAEALDSSCPVEWNLIAGIGRVESRHGTIGNATVQVSGRVTNSILGPLLDGGATEREAAEAAAAAKAAALAEAEAEAAAEPEEPPEPVFDATIWGDDTLTRAEELRESAAAPEGVGAAAPPVEVDDEPAPRYDPLLWGDDLPFDEEDLPPLDDSQATEDESEESEEPEFRGNGFAVIHDSDNGRLDGNSRWDRAVGPMQFIPETWSYWATDGNGDGVTDPQNLYDAAASAGRFLCHLSRTKGPSPSSFVLGYNSSQTYVRNVMAVADAFAAASLPVVLAD